MNYKLKIASCPNRNMVAYSTNVNKLAAGIIFLSQGLSHFNSRAHLPMCKRSSPLILFLLGHPRSSTVHDKCDGIKAWFSNPCSTPQTYTPLSGFSRAQWRGDHLNQVCWDGGCYEEVVCDVLNVFQCLSRINQRWLEAAGTVMASAQRKRKLEKRSQ